MVESRREHNLRKVLKITLDGAQAHGSNYKEYGQQNLGEQPLPVPPGVMHTFQQHGHHPLCSQSKPTHGRGPSETYKREEVSVPRDRGNHLNCFNSGKFWRWAFKVQSFKGVTGKVHAVELIFHKMLQEANSPQKPLTGFLSEVHAVDVVRNAVSWSTHVIHYYRLWYRQGITICRLHVISSQLQEHLRENTIFLSTLGQGGSWFPMVLSG